MADTWEWGPWAQQGEDYVKSERDKKNKIAIQNNEAGNQLKNLLAGQQQKENFKMADEERAAQNAVPALRTMLGGAGSEAGQALGFSPASTEQDYRGLAKGAPGIATTIINKQMENLGNKNKPVNVPKGGALVSPTGTELYKNEAPEQQGGLSFPTPQAAEAYWSQWAKTDPEGTKKYSPEVMADPVHGGYKLNLHRGEPLTPQDPNKVVADMEMKGDTSSDVYKRAKAAQSNYNNAMAIQAGNRQFQITQNTPATFDNSIALSKALQATNAFGQLASFTEPERRAFVLGPGVAGVQGLTNPTAIANYLSGLPGGANIVNALGGSQAAINRFNQFHALLGSIREMAFVTGGKQLTKTEEDVVLAKLPTGKEKNYSEFQAKFNYAEKLLRAVTQGMILSNQIPKGDPEYDKKMGEVWRQAFQAGDISLTDKEDYRKHMKPGDRIRKKADD